MVVHVGVIHNSLNAAGGAEKVCLVAIEALKSQGHFVELVTTDPTDWYRLSKLDEDIIRPDKETALLPINIKRLAIYRRLLANLKANRLSRKFDLMVNTYPDLMVVASDIMYMHFPEFALLKQKSANLKYARSNLWKLYFKPYESIHTHLVNNLLQTGLILTNSNFSARIIKQYTGKEASVLYPPVNTQMFLNGEHRTRDLVVTCGRYGPEKNYELILEVATRLKDVKFIIMGSCSGRVGELYYQQLERLRKSKHLANVTFMRDVSHQQMIEQYKKGKIFLHCMTNEPFGIAIVEAMASGLVPVVHKSGGAWEDILVRGEYGYGYENSEEASVAITNAMKSSSDFRLKLTERSKVFSKEKFIEGFLKLSARLE